MPFEYNQKEIDRIHRIVPLVKDSPPVPELSVEQALQLCGFKRGDTLTRDSFDDAFQEFRERNSPPSMEGLTDDQQKQIRQIENLWEKKILTREFSVTLNAYLKNNPVFNSVAAVPDPKNSIDEIIDRVCSIVPFNEEEEKNSLPPITLVQAKEILGFRSDDEVPFDSIDNLHKELISLFSQNNRQDLMLKTSASAEQIEHVYRVLVEARDTLELYIDESHMAAQAAEKAKAIAAEKAAKEAVIAEKKAAREAVIAAEKAAREAAIAKKEAAQQQKELTIASLRWQFCQLSGIDIERLQDTAESNAREIKKVFNDIFPDTRDGRNKKSKMEALIDSLFPSDPVSYENVNLIQKDWSQLGEEKKFLDEVVKDHDPLREKIYWSFDNESDWSFDTECNEFLQAVFEDIKKNFSGLFENSQPRMPSWIIGSFLEFAQACKIDAHDIEKFPDNEFLDHFIASSKHKDIVHHVLNYIKPIYEEHGKTEKNRALVKEMMTGLMEMLSGSENSFVSSRSKHLKGELNKEEVRKDFQELRGKFKQYMQEKLPEVSREKREEELKEKERESKLKRIKQVKQEVRSELTRIEEEFKEKSGLDKLTKRNRLFFHFPRYTQAQKTELWLLKTEFLNNLKHFVELEPDVEKKIAIYRLYEESPIVTTHRNSGLWAMGRTASQIEIKEEIKKLEKKEGVEEASTLNEERKPFRPS